jgi:hypothetical protein
MAKMRSLVIFDPSSRRMDEIGNAPCQGGSGKNGKNGNVRTDHFLELRLIEGWGYRIAGLSRRENCCPESSAATESARRFRIFLTVQHWPVFY